MKVKDILFATYLHYRNSSTRTAQSTSPVLASTHTVGLSEARPLITALEYDGPLNHRVASSIGDIGVYPRLSVMENGFYWFV